MLIYINKVAVCLSETFSFTIDKIAQVKLLPPGGKQPIQYPTFVSQLPKSKFKHIPPEDTTMTLLFQYPN